jgi:L-fuconolactonase
MNSPALHSASSRRIDAHQHLWHYIPEEFGWLDESMAMLRQNFLVSDLVIAMDGADIDASVAVQARCSLAETDWLLFCTEQTSRIAAVVGWVPLSDATVAVILDRFLQHDKFSGVREVAQGQPEGFFERRSFQAGVERLTETGLVYEILIYANQLPETIRLVDNNPQQSFVLDHAAKPNIKHAELEPWRTHMLSLAKRPNVVCKLSGLVTEANWSSWTLDTLASYLDVCVEAFGTERLIAGSDWPVCLVATSYRHWWDTLANYFDSFSHDETAKVFGGNASRIYKIPESSAEVVEA